jgi:transcription factor SFP1
MFDHSCSPPPLHHSPATSDQSQFPSRDSTPVTPVGSGPQPGKKWEKDREYLPWFKKPIDVGRTTTSLCLDTTLLEPDFDDHSFPLFCAPPLDHGMATAASPINIRQTSTSPRGSQPSNLTSALQRSSSRENGVINPVDLDGMERPHIVNGDTSAEGPSRVDNGAKPISMKGVFADKNRRESIAQSLGTGMSWGGISVGSWIRDEYVFLSLREISR